MSLRVRLSLIISLLFLSGMVLGVSFQISNARQRVAQEVESTARLTYQLLDSLLPVSGDAARDNLLLLEILRGVENARHLDIQLVPGGETAAAQESGTEIAAPAWFVRLVRPRPLEFVQPTGAGGERIVIRTNPADEIEEVWRESKNFLAVLLVVLLVLNGILYFTIGRWFKPVAAIVAGLQDAEQGDYTGRIAPAGLPELRVIAEKLNRLTGVLRASKAENDRLARRSLAIQEEERRHLARELHDEMGQSISAIKAIAFSIGERCRDNDELSAEGAARIQAISNHVRDHVRSMMGRLRPAVLDELGLVAALQHMVDEWNEHHRDIFCRLKVAGEFHSLDPHQQIQLYRIVQEALTNIASHAEADEAEVELVGSGQGSFRLRVRDNGRGFDPEAVSGGMGLAGMRERARALGGQCRTYSAAGRGASIEIDFPG